jgi:hypothetical protein
VFRRHRTLEAFSSARAAIKIVMGYTSGIGDHLDRDEYLLPVPVHELATTEQLPAIGLRHHHGSHMSDHEKCSARTEDDIKDHRNGALQRSKRGSYRTVRGASPGVVNRPGQRGGAASASGATRRTP